MKAAKKVLLKVLTRPVGAFFTPIFGHIWVNAQSRGEYACQCAVLVCNVLSVRVCTAGGGGGWAELRSLQL